MSYSKLTGFQVEKKQGSAVMADKQKISTNDLIAKYPQGITITQVDVIKLKDGTEYPVFNFREDETKFFNGGTVAKNTVAQWIENFGSIKEINEALSEGLKVLIAEKRTKTGRPYITFDVLEQ